MSTSEKLVVKLDSHLRLSPKNRQAARKANSAEAAWDDPEVEAPPPAKKAASSPAELPAMTQWRTATTPSMHKGNEFVYFSHKLLGKNYLQGSLAHFRADPRPLWHTEPDNTRSLSCTEPPAHAICMSQSPSEFLSNIYLVFSTPI